ncbi:ATP-binding protein [Limnobacter sp. 130]|uniref:ATP-binding protein n=1 Tax=Limnobacter sp. 130 TaxID=2653147 RepID=UPI0013589D5D|nr:ATP-binding protein [Limnobacter sp. 130]
MIAVTGPRQVGKTTMVNQVLDEQPAAHRLFVSTEQREIFSTNLTNFVFDSNDTQDYSPAPRSEEWLVHTWNRARAQALRITNGTHYILAIDEIQKIPNWSEVVKGLWDKDRTEKLPMHVVLLGSSPWLMQKGLTESLAGRFERIHLSHWSFREMQEAFDFTLDQYIYFGGYPGSASLIGDEQRWRAYVQHSLIDPIINKDILEHNRIHKPALLKQLFELGCGAYSGQILALSKIVDGGLLQEAGNTTTLSDYIGLLSAAELLSGLQKYANKEHRKRASPPKFNAHNTALMSALAGYTFAEAKADRSHWGRLAETCVGAHLMNTAQGECDVHYWRESGDEVDFVLSKNSKLLGIEVKSGKTGIAHKGLQAFSETHTGSKTLLVGDAGIPVYEFLSAPASHWLG